MPHHQIASEALVPFVAGVAFVGSLLAEAAGNAVPDGIAQDTMPIIVAAWIIRQTLMGLYAKWEAHNCAAKESRKTILAKLEALEKRDAVVCNVPAPPQPN